LVIFALFLEVMQTKNQFIKILHGYLSSTEEDAWQIQALKEAYPYSQVLHALAARLSKDHHLPTEQADLQRAAVHAGDRAVLKEIMTRVHTPRVSADETPTTPVGEVVEEHAVAEDVMNELHRLHELRQNFENLFEAESARLSEAQSEAQTEEVTPSEPEQVETPPVAPKKPKGRVGRKPGRAKAQRIIELARALNAQQQNAEGSEREEQKKSSGQKKNAASQDDLIIDAIEQSKKKLAPASERQQEQLEIIEEFINASPSISNIRSRPTPASNDDLSQVKAGEFGDHLVSETLVEILINQGKKERAIEVLKKLIWKFPQKKAYFAAQIEDLRK
jgi:hypothetical protein